MAMSFLTQRLVGERYWYLFAEECKQLFVHPRGYHFIPLVIAGLFITAWVYPVASPFVPVVIVVFAGLELQYNNIFFRTPTELESLMLFPVPWKNVIVVKNLATVALSILFFALLSMTLLYFSPAVLTGKEIMHAGVYLLTILFPLIHLGNLHSVQTPRRESGLRIDDFAEALWMMLNLGLVSVPYYLFTNVFEMPLLCVPYVLMTIAFWHRISLRKTTELIEKEQMIICSNR